MNKTKNHNFNGNTFKTYFKPAGNGWEIGCTFEGKTLWMGNFVHKTEATQWWKTFNTEITFFFNKWDFPVNASPAFMTKFFANYMYQTYYTWLDKKFSQYTKDYTKACKQNAANFKKLKTTTWKRQSERAA